MNYRLLTPPAEEPVTVDEAKAAARISDLTAFDDQIQGLIAAAREMAEQYTGRRFVTQVWRVELTDFPSNTDVIGLYAPTDVDVSYWDGSAWAAFTSIDYGDCGHGFVVAPTYGSSWPTLGYKSVGPRVRIDVSVGGDAADTPTTVQTYIKAMVAWWIDNPSGSEDRQPSPHLNGLLDHMRVY